MGYLMPKFDSFGMEEQDILGKAGKVRKNW